MATYPTTSSASDVWSLRDVYKAEAGDDWPDLISNYGTLVGAFETDWNTGVFSEGVPQLSSSDVILSDADFQSVRSNASSGLVYYVWGDSLEFYVSFNRSEIESANVSPAPTTTINPSSFGEGNGNKLHFWEEVSGSNLIGSDYSLVGFNPTTKVRIFEFSSIKAVDHNVNLFFSAEISSKFYIFYK